MPCIPCHRDSEDNNAMSNNNNLKSIYNGNEISLWTQPYVYAALVHIPLLWSTGFDDCIYNDSITKGMDLRACVTAVCTWIMSSEGIEWAALWVPSKT